MDEYEIIKKDYDNGAKWHTEKSSFYKWDAPINRFISLLKGKKILDAGCGSGRDTQIFLIKGFEVDGIDFSKEAIRIAKQTNPKATFQIGDIRKMNYPAGTFDGIWACATILNLKKTDVPKTLLGFQKVLKPNGILFVSVKEGTGEKLIPDQAGTRLFSFYAQEEIETIIAKAGFKIISAEITSDFQFTNKTESKKNPNWILVYAQKALQKK